MQGTQKEKSSRYLLIVPIAVILIVVLAAPLFKTRTEFPPNQSAVQDQKLTIGEKVTISVERADTPEKRELGLSYRKSLAENQGMLFVFDEPGLYAFWMKGMNFPLDMIWIGEDNTVVDIHENVPSPSSEMELTELPYYSPKVPAKMNIEVNAGFVEKYNIQIGDVVKLDNDN